MQPQSTEVNPIAPRANSKCITLGGSYYLIGGMTADQISSSIYQFVLKQIDGRLKVEWKKLQFKKNLFKNTNSFAACGVPASGNRNNCIYIWGGLQSSQFQQKSKSELIQIDLDKRDMNMIKLKQNVKIHSSSIMYDHTETDGRLVAFGGTDQSSTLQCFLQSVEQQHQWKKSNLNAKQHEGFVWQHTSHITNFSLFDEAQGRFLTVIGGCRYPQTPYPYIIEFDLNQLKQRNCIKMKSGLVSHDSLVTTNQQKKELLIFGGSNGGDFSSSIIKFCKGQLSYKNAHPAIGCSVAETQKAFIVIGGVCGPLQINGIVIYKKENQ